MTLFCATQMLLVVSREILGSFSAQASWNCFAAASSSASVAAVCQASTAALISGSEPL